MMGISGHGCFREFRRFAEVALLDSAIIDGYSVVVCKSTIAVGLIRPVPLAFGGSMSVQSESEPENDIHGAVAAA
jgi:hypothetical protein